MNSAALVRATSAKQPDRRRRKLSQWSRCTWALQLHATNPAQQFADGVSKTNLCKRGYSNAKGFG